MSGKITRFLLVIIAVAVVGGISYRVVESQTKKQALEEKVRARMQRIASQEATFAATAAPAAPAPGPSPKAATETDKPSLQPKTGVYFTGELRPANEAELAFKVGGRLARILVTPGDTVQAGQSLLVLEDREASLQVKQAKAGVEAAKAQASMADDAQKRVAQIGASTALSEQQKLSVGDQARLANASLSSAEAMLELAEANLANHTLRAPFAGKVTRVPSGVGAMVAPGMPLTGVVDASKWKIVATASVDDGGRLKAGDAVSFNVVGLKEGQLRFVSPVLQERSRRVQFEVLAAPEAGATLFAGQVVSGVVRVKQ